MKPVTTSGEWDIVTHAETFPKIHKTPDNQLDWFRISIYDQLRAGTVDGDATAARMLAERLSIHIERDDIDDPARVAAALAAVIERAGVALVRMPEIGERMGKVRDRAIALGCAIRAVVAGDR
jgi:hypothetical protein